jgi:hypothetical protein
LFEGGERVSGVEDGGVGNASLVGPHENPMNAAEGSSCTAIADFTGVERVCCRSIDDSPPTPEGVPELPARDEDWKRAENANPFDNDSSYCDLVSDSVWTMGCSLYAN